jgi:hypothetical protein
MVILDLVMALFVPLFFLCLPLSASRGSRSERFRSAGLSCPGETAAAGQ